MNVVVKRVRDFDVRDLVYRSPNPGETAVAATKVCMQQSTAIWLGLADGTTAAAFGVVPPSIFSDEAYIWLLHTYICEEHPYRFIRWSRKVIGEAQALYPRLWGLCDVSNLRSRRWLEWLGANFEAVGDPLRKFHIG